MPLNDPFSHESQRRRQSVLKHGMLPNSKIPSKKQITPQKTHKVSNVRNNKNIKVVIQNKLKPVNHPENQDRPSKVFMNVVEGIKTKVELPELGSFNAGLAIYDEHKYVCVYRRDEYSFVGCLLDKKLQVCEKYFHKFHNFYVADPRLIWINDSQLLMVYATVQNDVEYIEGSIILDKKRFPVFLNNKPFRISPSNLHERQKNWMPFVHEEKIYLIASVCPHVIYELKIFPHIECQKVFETHWEHPWPVRLGLRGNTNPVLLDDGNYLATFHTSQYHNNICHYDNGCYVFEGKPPFKVLSCSNRTYLPAESAVEKHFRKEGLIKCIFPVGMVKENKDVLISYGENDSVVKILRTKISDLVNLTVSV